MSITVQSQMKFNHFASGVNNKVSAPITEAKSPDDADFNEYVSQRNKFIRKITQMVVDQKFMRGSTQKIRNVADIYMYMNEYMFPLIQKYQEPKIMEFAVHAFNRSYDFKDQIHRTIASQTTKNYTLHILSSVKAKLASVIQEHLYLLRQTEQTKLALDRIRNMENETTEYETEKIPKTETMQSETAPVILRRSPRNIPRVNYAGMA